MRWPFFFGRGSAAKPSGGPEPRPPVRDWASMPALQRAVGEPHLTAPTADFVRSLAGTHDPDLSLEALGHHVSLDAAGGLVTGLTRTVETYSPSHELVARPRPRRERPVQRRMFASDETDGGLSAPEAAETEVAPEPATMAFTIIDEPLRASAPLTRLSDPEASSVVRLATPRPTVETAPVPQHEPAPGGVAPEAAPRPVATQRLTLGQSRRLGLGAPITSKATAAVQRSIDDAPPDLVLPRSAPPAGEADSASPQEVEVTRPDIDGPVSAGFERIAPLAGPTIQRRATTEAGYTERAAELPLARTYETAAVEPPSARPSFSAIQRVVATPLPSILPRPAPMPTAPIAPDRPALLTVRGAAGSMRASIEAAEAVEPVTFQRSPAAGPHESAAPMPQLDFVPGAAVASRELVTTPAPSPRSVARPAPAGPTVQRVAAPAHDFVAYSPFLAPPATPLAQRAAVVTEVPVQREAAAGEAPVPEPSAASAPVSPGGNGAAASGEAPGHSEKELDDLARKLHDRISLHLRRELLIQRERAGMVSDLR
jgi:hypothetical protein